MTAAPVPEPRRPRWYWGYLTALLVMLGVGLMARSVTVLGVGLPESVNFYLLVGLAIVVALPPFTRTPVSRAGRRLPRDVSTSVCFAFAISVNWNGQGIATLTQVLAVLVAGVLLRQPLSHTIFEVGRYGLAMFAAASVFVAAAEPIGIASDLAVDGLVIAGALAWFAVFHLLTAVEERLRTGGAWRWVLGHHLVDEALQAAGLLILGLFVVTAARSDAWFIPLMLIPMYSAAVLRERDYQRILRAGTDPLTGLPTRHSLATELAQRTECGAPATGGPPAGRFALMIADINRFKDINDVLGHEAGDAVLKEVARRLAGALPPDTTVGRLGADQFAILTPYTGGPDLTHRSATVAAVMADRVDVEQIPLHISCVIGAAVCPDDGTDFSTLLSRADTAVHEAKRYGQAFVRYRPETQRADKPQLALLADLREALEAPDTGGLEVHYQPQVNLDTGQPVGVEALLRWHHPTRGPIPPRQIMQVAEPTDLMFPLTQRVISEALMLLSRFSATRYRDVPPNATAAHPRVSVNVSARDLYQPQFTNWLADRLRETDIPPDQFQVEITETALITEPDRVLPALHRLYALGIGVSLDDFGTGYSSLAHLRRLPVTEVKIDRSFIATAANDPADEALVHSIIDLAHRLGLRVVAEGIEDEATRQLLLAAGCDYGQGWYYAPAMPADQLIDWIVNRRSESEGAMRKQT